MKDWEVVADNLKKPIGVQAGSQGWIVKGALEREGVKAKKGEGLEPSIHTSYDASMYWA
jgi:hypothetical protein